MIELRVGDTVPADVRLIECMNLETDAPHQHRSSVATQPRAQRLGRAPKKSGDTSRKRVELSISCELLDMPYDWKFV